MGQRQYREEAVSEPAKGAWRIGRTGVGSLPSMAIAQQMAAPDEASYQASAILPAAAQVVEMPVAPGDPPCVYVRGQRVLRWMVMRYGTEIVSVHESVAAARSALERSGCHSDTPDYCMCALVVIETRTKEAAGE